MALSTTKTRTVIPRRVITIRQTRASTGCSCNERAILGRKYYGTLNKECRIAERPKKDLAGFG
jgi:hypothetical protein